MKQKAKSNSALKRQVEQSIPVPIAKQLQQQKQPKQTTKSAGWQE